LEQVFLQVLQFSSVSVFVPPVVYTLFIYHRRYIV
jgi:hypothetical protein